MGSAFSQQPLGVNSQVTDETPGGTLNGSNTAFTTANNYVGGSLEVYKNGIRLQEGASNDFTENGTNSFTLTTAPQSGDILVVDYKIISNTKGNADTLDGQHGSYYLDRTKHTGDQPADTVNLYEQRKSYFLVEKSSDQTISTSALTTVTNWTNNSSTSDDVSWNATTGVATIQNDGTYIIKYFLDTVCSSGSARSGGYSEIKLNASDIDRTRSHYYWRQATYGATGANEWVSTCSANDTIELQIYQNVGADTCIVDNAILIIERIA